MKKEVVAAGEGYLSAQQGGRGRGGGAVREKGKGSRGKSQGPCCEENEKGGEGQFTCSPSR
jgi:hypothetical protein